MHHKSLLGRLGESAGPVQQRLLVGMGRETAQRMHRGTHFDVVPHQAHALFTVHQAPAQRSSGLKAADQHRTFGAAQVVVQVVQHPAGIAHAAGRQNHCATLDAAQLDGIFHIADEVQLPPLRQPLRAAQQLARLGIKSGKVLECDGRGCHRHGRVDKNLHRRQAALFGQLGKVVEQLLRAAHGKGRNHHIAARHGVVDHLHQLFQRGAAVLVQPVAVGGFDQQHIGILDRRGVAQDGAAGLAQIAAGHQLARAAQRVAEPDLDDGRSQNMPGIRHAHLHCGVR